MGAQKNRLIETVLLSTHNICFGCEIRKLNFRYALLTKVLNNSEALRHSLTYLNLYWFTLIFQQLQKVHEELPEQQGFSAGPLEDDCKSTHTYPLKHQSDPFFAGILRVKSSVALF